MGGGGACAVLGKSNANLRPVLVLRQYKHHDWRKHRGGASREHQDSVSAHTVPVPMDDLRLGDYCRCMCFNTSILTIQKRYMYSTLMLTLKKTWKRFTYV
jgi:hypothetical protein